MELPFLLDTTVLLHWTRASRQAQAIVQRFHLAESSLRPLACEVSVGEMLAFSRSLGWGPQKRERLAEIERQLVVVDISDRRVMEAFADLSTVAQRLGWSLFHGKNDLWVAAAAKATGAHLLSMDKDFLPLVHAEGWHVTILDDRTGEPITGV